MSLETLKQNLSHRAESRNAYACHGVRQAYQMPITGWNHPAADGSRWIESLSGAGLRFVDHADKLARLRHTGWFCAVHSDETYRGCVLRLPGRAGKNRYLAAYEDPNNPGTYRVDVSRGFFEGYGSDYHPSNRCQDVGACDAALAADEFARIEAEKARGWDEAWHVGARYGELGENVKEDRRAALALIREIKEAKAAFSPEVCRTLKMRLEQLRDRIAGYREERAKLVGVNAWWELTYGDAFNDGAGEAVFRGARA
jgi:hypothetical protein